MYSEAFLDHFKNPRNVGDLEPPAITVEISKPICGDILRLAARFDEDRVAEVRYKVRGCTASIAAARHSRNGCGARRELNWRR